MVSSFHLKKKREFSKTIKEEKKKIDKKKKQRKRKPSLSSKVSKRSQRSKITQASKSCLRLPWVIKFELQLSNTPRRFLDAFLILSSQYMLNFNPTLSQWNKSFPNKQKVTWALFSLSRYILCGFISLIMCSLLDCKVCGACSILKKNKEHDVTY